MVPTGRVERPEEDEYQDIGDLNPREKTPGVKRKARTSPGVMTHSEEKEEKVEQVVENVSARLRKNKRKTKTRRLVRKDEESGDNEDDEREVSLKDWEEGEYLEERKGSGTTHSENNAGNIISKDRSRVQDVSRRQSLRNRKNIMVISSEEEEEHRTLQETTSRKNKKVERRTVGKLAAEDPKKKEPGRAKAHHDNNASDPNLETEEDIEDYGNNSYCQGKEKVFRGKRREERKENEYIKMTIHEIRDYMMMLLDDADTARIKTKMQGGLSGMLKDRILGLKGTTECILKRLEEKEDAVYYKTKNSELMAENRRLRKKKEKDEREKSRKDQEIDAFRELYEKMENKYVEAEKRIHKLEKSSYMVQDEVGTREIYGLRDDKDIPNKQMEVHMVATTDQGSVGEVVQTGQLQEDERWPVLRPPIQGRRKRLGNAGIQKRRNLDITDYESVRSSEASPRGRMVENKDLPREAPYTRGRTYDNDRGFRYEPEGKTTLEIRDDGSTTTGRPRILSNIQIVPPGELEQDKESLTPISGNNWQTRQKKEDKKGKEAGRQLNVKKNMVGERARKPLRAAVVAIRTKNEGVSYANVLKRARQEISLVELGINNTRIRRGINGSMMIEIPGQDSREKADRLAGKLKEKLGEEEVIITRPNRMAEITGLDASVTREEIKDVIIVGKIPLNLSGWIIGRGYGKSGDPRLSDTIKI